VNKFASLALVAVVAVLCVAAPTMAQDGAGPATNGNSSFLVFSSTFGAGLVTIGAAYGISKLASAAVESMARQPEVAGTIQVAMIIAAALIEGFTFFALFICMQGNK
jgi:F-type H+-transporting ATPase subunit c